MRLLSRAEDGNFSLTQFSTAIPRYAIFSHTWGHGWEDEVSFEDLLRGSGRDKPGWLKVLFCSIQAAKDGLQYFWIDTCCIDRSSSSELSEAINSMFIWHKKAATCYVYLHDVLVGEALAETTIWMPQFKRARWFTRCWTLQELLAPRHVQFFDQEWAPLGSRESLAPEIHEITRLPLSAIRGEAELSEFSIEERLSWVGNRQTAIEEDAAYSLLGIFGVFMPLIYGEGRTHAMTRLMDEIKRSQDKAVGRALTVAIHQQDTKSSRIQDMDSDPESDVDSIFSKEGSSVSSASTASLDTVQTIGIREVARILLSRSDLEDLYTVAVRKNDRRKSRRHIRGFLKQYGQNLSKEARNRFLELHAAKFIRELARRIADEIIWHITGLSEPNRPQALGLAKQDLESRLSILQANSSASSGNAEESNKSPMLFPDFEDIFDEDESDEETDERLQFPNINRVKNFMLNSPAFANHVAAIRAWLKVDDENSNDDEAPLAPRVRSPRVLHSSEEATREKHSDSAGHGDENSVDPSPERSTEAEAHARGYTSGESIRRILDKITDSMLSYLDYWGVAFLFYDLLELISPRVRPGYQRIWWRCSCNTVLWGDFLVDGDDASDHLRHQLSSWTTTSPRNAAPERRARPGPNAKSAPYAAEELELGDIHFTDPSGSNNGPAPGVSNITSAQGTYVVNVHPSPKYFEVCVNIGDHAIDHHEIDISDVNTDGKLFTLIWKRYNSSRGIGWRRLFLRPKNVHFVMFSVGRRTKFGGAGIHKKPDEFPPKEELEQRRYHYFSPKIRMPSNVFLHYLHRARWSLWGEHKEDIWLQRLPKKLSESVLAEAEAVRQQDPGGSSNRGPSSGQQEGLTMNDPDLAFGWGVHILDGPNYAVLSLLLLLGIVVAFAVSGMVIGFAKTKESGFGVGNFLLAILAAVMGFIYSKLQQDQ